MSHKHECPDCGEQKWCEIPDCIFDPSDESVCDDCADKRRERECRKRAERALRGDAREREE